LFLVAYPLFKKPFLPIGFWNEMVDLVNKILSDILNRFITGAGRTKKGPFCEPQEWAFPSDLNLLPEITQAFQWTPKRRLQAPSPHPLCSLPPKAPFVYT
jgi:hypothetical protein